MAGPSSTVASLGATTQMDSTIRHLSELLEASKRHFEAANSAGLAAERAFAYQPLRAAPSAETASAAGLAAATAATAVAAAMSKPLDDQLDNQLQAYLSPEMSLIERHFWFFLFFSMVLVAAGGNMIVVYIVSTNRDMKSVTNYFLVNLSLADTMVSTLNVIFNFISMVNGTWPFGLLYCKISNFIAILSISASVFTLTAISCDRYNAILHPLRLRMSHRHAIAWILLIWSLSVVLALPNAIYSSLVEDKIASESVAVACTMIWPDGRYPTSLYDHIYNIMLFVVIYLVPIVTMAVLYYKVGRELWGYEAIGENIEKQRRALMAKKKIVKMMIVVVIIFALCWFPYHAFFVVNYYLPNIFVETPLHYQRFYLLMYWFAMSNSMYNPIIIYFMNSKFRHEIRRCLCFIFCCRSYRFNGTNSGSTSTTTNNNNNNNFNNSATIGRHYSSSRCSTGGAGQSKRPTICDNGQFAANNRRHSINSRPRTADCDAGPNKMDQTEPRAELKLGFGLGKIKQPPEPEPGGRHKRNGPLTNDSAPAGIQREAPQPAAAGQTPPQGHSGAAATAGKQDGREAAGLANGIGGPSGARDNHAPAGWGQIEFSSQPAQREANDVEEESKPFISGQIEVISEQDPTMTARQEPPAKRATDTVIDPRTTMFRGHRKLDADSGSKVWI